MNLDLLLKLVREPGSLEATNQNDLEALVQEYPYFTAAHLLLLKLYKQQNSIHFNKQLRKVAALAPSREHVYDLVEVMPLLEEPSPLELLSTDATEDNQHRNDKNDLEVEQTPGDLAAEKVAEAEEELQFVTLLSESLAEVESSTQEPEQASEIQENEEPSTEQAVDLDLLVEQPVILDESRLNDAVLDREEEVVQALTPVASALDSVLDQPLDSDYEPGAAAHPKLVEHDQHLSLETALENHTSVEAGKLEDHAFMHDKHDRLSWFRYFAGKPLREQPEDVLEQLYLEHMQQDLLKAPDSTPETSIKAKVNLAEEVESSVSMEEEIKRLAYDSISDDELPASETLARIYEQQNEFKRAIKIYQKLILKFPDKMTYFAVLIEELRKKA